MSLYSLNPHPASARLSPPRIVTLPQPGSPRPGPHPASARIGPARTLPALSSTRLRCPTTGFNPASTLQCLHPLASARPAPCLCSHRPGPHTASARLSQPASARLGPPLLPLASHRAQSLSRRLRVPPAQSAQSPPRRRSRRPASSRSVPCRAVPSGAVRCGAVQCSAVPRGCERSQGKKRAVVSGGRVRPGGRLMLAEAGCGAGRGELRQSVGRAEASEEKVLGGCAGRAEASGCRVLAGPWPRRANARC